MLRRLSLFCLVDGESTPFPIEIESTKTIGDLKDLVKAALSPQFDDITAKDLTIWSVSIPVSDDDDDEIPIVLDNVNSKDNKLRAMRGLLEVFPDKPPKNTIHIIVQRPPQAWRRGFGKPQETRPSLLFMDLRDPSTPDSTSRNLAAGSILKLVKDNNRCGKTRAVIELLSQHWRFYFNAADND
ncbi:hypothetical protein KI688_006459 [Linnemannia hyalina]|uniref:Crinkler effector protein N-terminal domain-containing protein n=1 Tax=Linnemannia hyalina TaxID=64524 RepID=A0A9P8BQP4_9FUNG|nr:hypothetical protein KI688_006459 [Linnemannia hyalina]